MRKHQLSFLIVTLTSCLIFINTNLIAQQEKKQPVTVVAVRGFTGFSELLSMDTLVYDLNVLNGDKSVEYVKYSDRIHPDYIVDVKSKFSYPKKITRQTFGTLTDLADPGGAVYNRDEIYVPDYSGEVKGARPIGSYYNNEFSLYDYRNSGVGIGTFKLTISRPGFWPDPVYKKAIYIEDFDFLIEESVFDEVVSNLFSYFRKQSGHAKSLN
jgi:hypothetical protein